MSACYRRMMMNNSFHSYSSGPSSLDGSSRAPWNVSTRADSRASWRPVKSDPLYDYYTQLSNTTRRLTSSQFSLSDRPHWNPSTLIDRKAPIKPLPGSKKQFPEVRARVFSNNIEMMGSHSRLGSRSPSPQYPYRNDSSAVAACLFYPSAVYRKPYWKQNKDGCINQVDVSFFLFQTSTRKRFDRHERQSDF